MNLSINLSDDFLENKKKIYIFLFLISLVSRILISYYYGDRNLENEWSILLGNLYNNNILSMIRFGDLFVPNLWMPPVYAYFIYLHAILFGMSDNLATYVIFTQILISSLTAIVFYKILSHFFSYKVSFGGAIVFSTFPLIVYSASQISSITIYLFLFLVFILLILSFINEKSKQYYWHYVIIGTVAGILILTRRDFILIYFFSIFYIFIFFKVSLKKILLVLIVTSITISPYLVRNYISFDKFIIHSGFGYNLWKAYNSNAKVEGYYEQSDELKYKISLVKKDINYRINEDKVFLEEAKQFIKNNPKEATKLFFKRLFSILFIDFNSSQKNYYNFFHIAPNILIAVLSFIGLSVYDKKNSRLNYLILIMIILLMVYSLFALLPRYKIYIIPFQILLSLKTVEYFLQKLGKKY
tara:strand:+ start:316 stop:1554 length:1239 start_codon:yes stop_codon:yes gene_type:complete